VYQRKDSYYRRAKASGLRSRAAFKLEDLAMDLIRRGDRVLDLGSWPGGWLQIASRRVGERGKVVGVDRRALDPLGLANVRFVQGDVREPETVARTIAALGGGHADVVLSDMAPNLSGIRDHDEAHVDELARLALDIARRTLRRDGSFLCKVFMSGAYPAFVAELRECFSKVSTTRPESTRKGSAELYVIAKGFLGSGADRSRALNS
jgi:23S rRNA (uridine2552-2'-O)-methyltransferase